jgi:hypothetical protein
LNYEEAKYVLLLHGDGAYDDQGEAVSLDEGFLSMLRPYRGLVESNFHVVMQALLVVGEQLHVAETVDRKLINSLWSTTSTMRSWGLNLDGMLQRNRLITDEDTRRLEQWVDVFERTALGLLNGCPPYCEVERYAQYIIDVGPGENISFFIPLMIQFLEDPDTTDPTVIAEALGKLGPIARDALPSLREARQRTYAEYCQADAQKLISEAIRQIESGS